MEDAYDSEIGRRLSSRYYNSQRWKLVLLEVTQKRQIQQRGNRDFSLVELIVSHDAVITPRHSGRGQVLVSKLPFSPHASVMFAFVHFQDLSPRFQHTLLRIISTRETGQITYS